jgi:serine/threonine-protein kinase RsbW
VWRNSRKAVAEQCRRDIAFSTLAEMPAVLTQLGGQLAALGYSELEVFNTRLAAEEAIVNAICHGHRSDPSRAVRVSYLITARRVVIRIQDQGPGFDPRQLPDPLDPENVQRLSGRGVFLMRATMTWVKFNRRGNSVTLCKKRTG